MTTPAASVLGRIAGLAGRIRASNALLKHVQHGTEVAVTEDGETKDVFLRLPLQRQSEAARMVEWNDASLAALPVATDEEAVKELARWLFDRYWDSEPRAVWPKWGTSSDDHESFESQARAILTELLAGGGGK